MENKTRIRAVSVSLSIMLIIASLFYWYVPRSSGASNVTETLNAQTCASLVTGQNASETFVASTCTISASTRISPFFLTNSSTTLIIPSTLFLTLNSGFGAANYGTLNITGTLIQKISFINYGQILNYKNWNVQNTFAQMNITGASVLTSGFVTNQPTGTITISSGVGFFYNGNRFINNGVVTNNGLVCNHISGLSQNGTITGSISGNAVSANC